MRISLISEAHGLLMCIIAYFNVLLFQTIVINSTQVKSRAYPFWRKQTGKSDSILASYSKIQMTMMISIMTIEMKLTLKLNPTKTAVINVNQRTVPQRFKWKCTKHTTGYLWHEWHECLQNKRPVGSNGGRTKKGKGTFALETERAGINDKINVMETSSSVAPRDQMEWTIWQGTNQVYPKA